VFYAMRRYLENAVAIVAFVALCATFVLQILTATQAQRVSAAARSAAPGAPWVCPILGECGPAGTPGLGRW